MTISLKLGFHNSHFISSCSKVGGLALIWNSSVNIAITSSYKYLINTLVTSMPDNMAWRVSFFVWKPLQPAKSSKLGAPFKANLASSTCMVNHRGFQPTCKIGWVPF